MVQHNSSEILPLHHVKYSVLGGYNKTCYVLQDVLCITRRVMYYKTCYVLQDVLYITRRVMYYEVVYYM